MRLFRTTLNYLLRIDVGGGKSYCVDGWVIGTRMVLEIDGCFHHGCLECYPQRDRPIWHGKTPRELYDKTCKRKDLIEDAGYFVTTKRECEIRRMLNENIEMKQFFDDYPDVGPIQFSDALSGGRTNVFRANTESTAEDHIQACDINSLYPSIMFYSPMPVGMPKRETGSVDFLEEPWTSPKDMDGRRGLLKVEVLAPTNLTLPVLGQKIDGKFIFSLCKRCARHYSPNQINYKTQCRCDDKERSFIGCWTHIELGIALKCGYKVLRFFEAYTWSRRCWSKDVFKGNLNLLKTISIYRIYPEIFTRET